MMLKLCQTSLQETKLLYMNTVWTIRLRGLICYAADYEYRKRSTSSYYQYHTITKMENSVQT